MSGHKHVRRYSGVGARRVLIPGTKQVAAHPWRARLRAAMDGKSATKTQDNAS